MGTLKLNTTSGGSLSIQAADGASDNTVTLPAVSGANIITSADSGTITQGMIGSGVATTGPAFGAWEDNNQSLSSSAFTKLVFTTEEFDTNNNFADSRFTPTVAGYYQINGAFTTLGSTAIGAIIIYKNGVTHKYGVQTPLISNYIVSVVSSLVYLNGSTDYVELYAIQTSGTTQNTLANQNTQYFNGFLARAV